MRSLAMIVVVLALVAGRQATGEDPNSVEVRQRRSHEVFKEFVKIGKALRDGAQRELIAGQFRDLAEKYPDTDRGKVAGELAVLLFQMAEEDRQFSPPGDIDALPQEQRISFCVHKLRDVAVTDLTVPGSMEVIRDARDPRNPAFALRKIGKAAVPALIGLLGDRRPTRSVGDPFNGAYVLRYSDVALQVLESITGRRFTEGRDIPRELGGTGRYFSNFPETWQKTITSQVQGWWETNRNKDESLWIRESLAKSGVSAFWYTIELAERLIELEGNQSVDFFRERLRLEPNSPWAVSLLGKAGGKQVVEDIRLKIHHRDLFVRAAAYRALLDAGETAVVNAAIEDLANTLASPKEKSDHYGALVSILVRADTKEAVLTAARLTRHPRRDVAERTLVSFQTALQRDNKPSAHLRPIVFPYMASVLDDTELGPWAAWWMITVADLNIAKDWGRRPPVEQEKMMEEVRVWWQTHRDEFPKAEE